MDVSWLLDPSLIIGFFTLIVLELVLGIDNLVFVAIIANKIKPELRDRARFVGLSLAIVIRLILLALASYIASLTTPLFSIGSLAISAKDILMIAGGFFLIYKATTELHEKVNGEVQYMDNFQLKTNYTTIGVAIIQIAIIDAIFSIDSVITAVGMVDHIAVAMLAVVIAMVFMIIGSKYLADFIDKHPTVVILCLGFLLLIGLSLILEGFHIHIPKGYIYAAILFSIIIEAINQISFKNRKENEFNSISWRRRTIDSVLGIMGVRENILANATKKNRNSLENQDVFKDNEKHMIRSVLTLAEKPIEAIMTPRREIEKLNLSNSVDEQIKDLQDSPHSRLIVVGKNGIEEPFGYINKKDILIELLEFGKFDINKLIKQALFIPETATVLTALELFRNSHADIGLVVDEFGTVLGLVSMKDIMEAIAGEFPEEYEKETPTIQTNDDQSITVDGSLDYDQLTQMLRLPPLPESTEFHSVGGLIMEELQRIPEVGDSIEYYGHSFEVIEKEGQKIERVKIKPAIQEAS